MKDRNLRLAWLSHFNDGRIAFRGCPMDKQINSQSKEVYS